MEGKVGRVDDLRAYLPQGIHTLREEAIDRWTVEELRDAEARAFEATGIERRCTDPWRELQQQRCVSRTVRAMGPAVSWLCAIGIMPVLSISPTVGFHAHQTVDRRRQSSRPFRYRPLQRFAETAAPEPELEPMIAVEGIGIAGSPPARAPVLLTECEERKLAHSLGISFAQDQRPGSLANRAATTESRSACDPSSRERSAVVLILSAVSILSLMRTGIPCSGPRGLFLALAIDSTARARACRGLISMTARSCGPLRSSALMPDKAQQLARCPAVQPGDTQLFQIEAGDVFGLLGGDSRSRSAEEGAAIHLSIIRCGMVAELFMVTLTLAQLGAGELLLDKVGISRAGLDRVDAMMQAWRFIQAR